MKKIIILFAGILMLASCSAFKKTSTSAKEPVMLHAHRGGTGLMPENTIPSMKNGVKCGADYLELDFVFSKDKQIVVSHDLYMNMAFTLKPDGSKISKEENKKIRLASMTYDSIAKYDVGSLDYPKFPSQKKLKVSKPLLSVMIDSVEWYAAQNHLPKPHYNIEVKNSWKQPKDAVGYYPNIEEVAHRIVALIREKGIENRCLVQTFEAEMVTVLHRLYPNLVVGYLTSDPNFDADIKTIGFVPNYYNPQFQKVDAALVKKAHDAGAKIVPWIVDSADDMNALLKMGVDGIITDYPNIGRPVVDKFNQKK